MTSIHPERELNPSLGLVGVRALLKHQAVLRRQLQGILRAAGECPEASAIRIAIPKVTDCGELRKVKEILFEERYALKKSGLVFRDSVSVGIVVETPASVIGIEDQNVANMTRPAAGDADNPGRNVRAKSGLNRELLNVAPFMFRTLLTYKAEAAGVEVVVVNPAYTSQTCSACGVVNAEYRKGRIYNCKDCGHVEHADLNAAKNILSLALGAGEAAPVAGRRKAPSDPYSGQLETGTATLNPIVSPLWARIAPHFSTGPEVKKGGSPDGYT